MIIILLTAIVVLLILCLSQLVKIADNQRYNHIDVQAIAATFGQHLEEWKQEWRKI